MPRIVLVDAHGVRVKTCWKCKEPKPYEDFQKDSSRGDGLSHCCRFCNSVRQREFHVANPHKKFEYKLRNQWSIDVATYNNMLAEQDGRCASCRRDFGTKSPFIDHDHKCCNDKGSCGKCIRGLLCHWCNTSAGLLNDDPATIRLLAEYLERTSV